MRDIIFYDSTHTGPVSREAMNTRHIGGANVATVLLAEALAAQGLDVEVKCSDNGPDESRENGVTYGPAGGYNASRRHVIQRFSTVSCFDFLKHEKDLVVAAHDFGDERHAHLKGLRFVCVSRFQAENFAHLGPTHVIPPILGSHVARGAKHEQKNVERWAFASERSKGLDATRVAWSREVRLNRSLRVIAAEELTADALVRELERFDGMFYRNGPSAECFPVVVAIARALGLKLDVACVGHERCGLQEARDIPLEEMRPEAVAKRWIDYLELTRGDG